MGELSEPVVRALGAIPSGLFIATAGTGSDATGFLASWVQQIGFEPPCISMAVRRGRPAESLVRDLGTFCIAIVDEASKSLLGHFGRGFAPGEPAFDGVATADSAAGVPYPTDAFAWLACRVVGEVAWTDHVLFCGEVVGGGHRGGDAAPLVHVRKNGLDY
jgi:flavin reductase (DIM6/NTAB) family NADH-FMN oxidoreductase RutF